MHFVIGGAFNGKGKWVYHTYQLRDREDWNWYNNYKNIVTSFPHFTNKSSKVIVISGIEQFVKEIVRIYGAENTRESYKVFLQEGLNWEQEDEGRYLILIGADITKGVVPVSEEERTWRDYVGWCYQDTVTEAEQVDVVWYGIPQKVKS
ncbi:bifunctional adenosylcobinamide kinase/adenosylcobinamide-phosphate guanylyltransferase [Anaerobacillus sp. MEB173]|uniref:bifunctional adenosylcobinamide kinase/adenosylcobinamide-phosphate guanylyltransferase n=1 Tax=Anaerobacillus sp. MEB173 TaxID=3383345 RepID=UPI003F908DD3